MPVGSLEEDSGEKEGCIGSQGGCDQEEGTGV